MFSPEKPNDFSGPCSSRSSGRVRSRKRKQISAFGPRGASGAGVSRGSSFALIVLLKDLRSSPIQCVTGQSLRPTAFRFVWLRGVTSRTEKNLRPVESGRNLMISPRAVNPFALQNQPDSCPGHLGTRRLDGPPKTPSRMTLILKCPGPGRQGCGVRRFAPGPFDQRLGRTRLLARTCGRRQLQRRRRRTRPCAPGSFRRGPRRSPGASPWPRRCRPGSAGRR